MNNYKYDVHTHTHSYTRIHSHVHSHAYKLHGTEQYVILLWRTGNKKIIQVPGSIPRKLVILPRSMVFFFFVLFSLEIRVRISVSEQIASRRIVPKLSVSKIIEAKRRITRLLV